MEAPERERPDVFARRRCPPRFDDSANPAGNLVVDLVRGDARLAADRNPVGAHASVVGKLALISDCYGEYWPIGRR